MSFRTDSKLDYKFLVPRRIFQKSFPNDKMNAWSIAFWILFVLFLAGIGLFIWYYLRPKCPTGQTCLKTAPPACAAGSSCQNTANPCGAGRSCLAATAVTSSTNIPTCPICDPSRPIKIWGFISTNNAYSALSSANGVLATEGNSVVLKDPVSGNNAQAWLVETVDPNASELLFKIKNVSTSQYMSNTSGTALGLTPDKTSAASFNIIPVTNRQGRTYVFRTGTNDLEVSDDKKILLMTVPTATDIPNNAEWMVSFA